MSGGRVLFGRFTKGRSQVILRKLGSGRGRILADVSRRRGIAAAGQVNGNFAVWFVCGRVCEVYRYNIRTGGRTKMPRAAKRVNYGASVTRAGTVYYAQSGNPCGSNAELLRFHDGRVTQIEDLPAGDDLFYTYADDRSSRVLFDRVHCRGRRWDVLASRDSVKRGDAKGARPEKDEPPDTPAPSGDIWFEDLLPGRK
jgi:hypothetical protein